MAWSERIKIIFLYSVFLYTSSTPASSYDLRLLRLPRHHFRHLFFVNETLRKSCLDQKTACPYYKEAMSPACWGFESECSSERIEAYQHKIKCPLVKEQVTFWNQVDFGYLAKHSSSLVEYCKPKKNQRGQSNLICNDHLQICMGKNIVIDFRKIADKLLASTKQYSQDILTEKGVIQGNCKMDWDAFMKQADRDMFLSTWKKEIIHFTESEGGKPVFDELNPEADCDVVFDKTAFVVKLDAGVNMYHHYCDFVNIWTTQVMLGMFDMDLVIVNWHTSARAYYDLFSETWKAFSWHRPLEISELAHKRVCFRNVVFPMLPRLYNGLFFNTRVEEHCVGSSLFKGFHDFIIYRLNLTQNGPTENVRVLFLNRKTKHRNVVNVDELVAAGNKLPGVEVKQVAYTSAVPLFKQYATTYNADIFIGMHGAGLAHALFLPDWAVLYEMYHCEDRKCYRDLAHERGLKYITWEKKEKFQTFGEGLHPITKKFHAKFVDYTFDVEEFVRQLEEGVAHVRQHPAYKKASRAKQTNKEEL